MYQDQTTNYDFPYNYYAFIFKNGLAVHMYTAKIIQKDKR